MKSELLICCPNCGQKFDLNRAMTEQARELFLADARHEVDQERSKVRGQVTQELVNEQALKDRERDSLIADIAGITTFAEPGERDLNGMSESAREVVDQQA
jgi:hypothetical protein